MKKDTVNIALIGAGTVGNGVLKIIQKNLSLLESKVGAKLRVTWICARRKPSVPKGLKPAPRLTSHWKDVVKDPSVDIVVELVGGYEPARTIVLSAIAAKKHIATANKALLAKYWGEVFTAAAQSGVLVYFEAAVASGIPVIQGLNEGLAANRIERIYGILNGTTNYILTRMSEEGLGFDEALREARKAGFAEADPSFDVEGTDAAHKIAILSSLATGRWIKLKDVSREGISRLDVWDVAFAKKHLGFVTKLLGMADLKKDTYCVRVHPVLIPQTHPFAAVSREYNAIFVHGDAAGDVMFSGKGAGQMAAASAVVSDVIYLARQVANDTAGEIPYVVVEENFHMKPLPLDQMKYRHYLRFTTVDKPGVLSRITGVVGRHDISIASVHQGDVPSVGRGVPIVIVTHMAEDGAVAAAIAEADKLASVLKKTVHLRIHSLQ